NIGSLYQRTKMYNKALEYYQKSLAIREELLGKLHSATAESYNNIGAVYKDMKHQAKALKYYQKAISIQKKVLPEKHPSLATAYNNLGLLYQALDKPSKALEYLHSALDIREKVLGGEHFLTAISYSSLSYIYQSAHKYSKSYHYAQLAFNNFLLNREKVFTVLDAKQKEKYLKSTAKYISSLLSSAYRYIYQLNRQSNTKEIRKILHSTTNAWLNYKGSIFDSENTIAMLYASTKDKKLKAKIDDLVSSKRYLAKLYQSLPKPKEIDSWKKSIKEIQEKINRLTKQIASKATIFKEQQGLKNISYQDITSHLEKDELYIDYAKAGEYYYLFSLDHRENISFTRIDKKSTKKINTLVKSFREDITAIINDTNITDKKLKTLTVSSKEKLSQLYDLIIKKPLGNIIKDKRSLIISPDGALRLLPFETLYDKENNQYFIQKKEIRYIPSGKELVRLYRYSKEKKSKDKNSTVIFANPNFNTKIASLSKEEIAITPNTNRSGIIKSLFRMRFAPLPGTKAEAKAIKATLIEDTVSEYQESRATESTLMKIKEPHILHIATHGFFINDATIPNPMLKSGIALAGANKSAIRGKSDGIVTALKLSGLDLGGTDLVVLSACQTGVVDINSTDSVSGLSKAFIQAGAKDIVMSLWSVDDEATKELMTSFYQEMKGKEKSYAEALKSAKLKMIEDGRHPFYWGAFVVSGL
ncbi:MAG: CHAT domain-containing tetratricopeptide repeat protein, partial [Campylobacterota bacterium]|nr:CHAT domain-containing tetratricopeptide repeat protein [Campylobacterota bacterium]